MNPENIIEAALFASAEPLSADKLSQLFPEESRPSLGEIRSHVANLQSTYQDRGVELVEVASGYRFQAKSDSAPFIQRLDERKALRYSRAFLETLALIAYRQPITRGEIEDVRGVAVNPNIIRTLMERDWIKIAGYRDVPGKPALFATTKTFLDHFNLKKISELPPLSELVDFEALEKQLGLQSSNDNINEDTDTSDKNTLDLDTNDKNTLDLDTSDKNTLDLDTSGSECINEDLTRV
ncbi:MAG: SMC-Scp complex subunit ScpB [Gammaproteobacteria bacterium RIFCSPLOWO2_02_FULL_42_14]|nr:MAG: SMC-Scp complex subunit ScpB [Gammaproteobacteria bacterium RIFCSPHIGHO2_02_FULL_42_43]OGT53054.1 MAG: SMC-Scp complex subunit ScpB [Gammaproteobacteria bacterium RIFCSPHIGHO2_12_FULL_41_25]OGT61172.1 MAG: SMC-Scp complex subunit ScpB [Gammaproteobacteria bacterium RIFCSPLOWO2_02_FULL_42_14]OGT87099.1 MAG: SMC-Scp complex subunit ScpB [Gammaproteobacteria bacterium RIFCSPLOWO2_12_FULL_42_18]